MNRLLGPVVVSVLRIFLISLTTLFFYFLRIYLYKNIGLCFTDGLAVFIGICAVSGSGGEVNPHGGGGPESSSGCTTFDLNESEEAQIREGSPSTKAGPSDSDRSVNQSEAGPSVNQAPAGPSREGDRGPSGERPHRALTQDVPSSSRRHEDDLELKELKERLNDIIQLQYSHYMEDVYPSWKKPDPQVIAIMSDKIQKDLKLEDSLEEHRLWAKNLPKDPHALNYLYKKWDFRREQLN